MFIKLVIFDLDGTLVDSLPDLADATNHMLSRFDRRCLRRSRCASWWGRGPEACREGITRCHRRGDSCRP